MSHTITQTQKERIVDLVISSCRFYDKNLINKRFLIITESYRKSILCFKPVDFLHLTGLSANMSPDRFYNLCRNGFLSHTNIPSTQHYAYRNIIAKLKILNNLQFLIYADASTNLFLINIITNTTIFPIGLRNDNKNCAIMFKGRDNHARSTRTARHCQNVALSERIICILQKEVSAIKWNKLIYIRNSDEIINNAPDLKGEIDDKLTKLLFKIY